MSSDQAIAMLLRGETEPGLALYRECLKGDGLPSVPVGLHLLFLERAGQPETAARLLALAIGQGANVAVKAGGFGADAREAAAEYEALFARGLANSRMVYEYLRVLAELGRTTELRTILDPARLLRTVKLDLPAPDGREGGLAQAVQGLLLQLEPKAEAQDAVQSVRNMRMLRHVSELADPAALALTAALSAEVDRYMADWRGSDHPLAQLVPAAVRLEAWGLISRGEGFNAHHIHQKGWATGIYYPTEIGEGEGGELRIGPPVKAAATADDWAATAIRPRAGLLVLMPSFYTHWTVPLTGPGLRTSIAFDVLPVEA